MNYRKHTYLILFLMIFFSPISVLSKNQNSEAAAGSFTLNQKENVHQITFNEHFTNREFNLIRFNLSLNEISSNLSPLINFFINLAILNNEDNYVQKNTLGIATINITLSKDSPRYVEIIEHSLPRYSILGFYILSNVLNPDLTREIIDKNPFIIDFELIVAEGLGDFSKRDSGIEDPSVTINFIEFNIIFMSFIFLMNFKRMKNRYSFS